MNRAYITVEKVIAEVINKALNWENGDSMDSRFGEDDQFACTADFGGGVEMDIKVCGVQYEEGGFNNAWAEAVLFDNGREVAVSEIDDDFFGEWELKYNGTTYVTEVVCADDPEPYEQAIDMAIEALQSCQVMQKSNNP